MFQDTVGGVNACQMCAMQTITDSAINLMMVITSVLQYTSSRVCLKEQLSIFTTQAMLELPKVATSCHGNSFVSGMSQPLAGKQLNRYCYLTATCVTCLLLICIQWHVSWYINKNEWCVNLTDLTAYGMYHKHSIWDLCFGTCTALLFHSGHWILWSSFMICTQPNYSMLLE